MKFLKEICERKICFVKMGHGSFFEIFFDNNRDNITKLWVYDTNWALTVNGVELVSSDDVDECRFPDLSAALTGKNLSHVEVLDSLEFHLDFEGGVTLELWVDEVIHDSLGAILLYSNDACVSEIRFPLDMDCQD